ncbi:MAG: helix-turn-helix domain-containing protein [Bacteroidaceae bacterium]|nr:helix-turn-helix domain-containing protein [Bacteroidaceae bacterium]
MVPKSLPTEHFLPSANLHHVARDNEGYMWYATEDGVCRDNGYQIDVFRRNYLHPDFWRSNYMVEFAIGRDDKVWVATLDGLYYIDKKDYRAREVVHESILPHSLSNVCVSSDSSVWVLTGPHVARLSPEGQVRKVYRLNHPSNDGHYASVIHEDSRQRLWLYECHGGVRRYDAKVDSFVRCAWNCPNDPHGGFFEDKKNRCFWIGTWGNGIIKYVLGKTDADHQVIMQPCTYEGHTLSESKGKVIDFTCDGKTIWCAAMDGFYAYDITDEGTLKPHPIDHLLPSGKKVFAAPYADAQKNIWVASYSPRTFILCPQEEGWKRYTIPSIQRETGVEMMVENTVQDTEEMVWLWHLRFGLVLWNPATNETNIVVDRQHQQMGSSLLERRMAGGAWSAEGNKVVMLGHEGMHVTRQEVVDVGHPIRCLLDAGNKTLWIGTDAGIFAYNPTTTSLTPYGKGLGKVERICQSKEGQYLYFISSEKGSGKIDTNNGSVLWLPNPSAERFTSLAVSPSDELWLGTDMGSIYHYEEKTNTLERDPDASLTDDSDIIQLAADGKGHLWVLASQSLKEYSPQHKTFRIIKADDDGVDLDYFLCMGVNTNAWEEGVYVGGAGGLCLFAPTAALDERKPMPVPIFTSVVLGGEKRILCQGEREVTLSPDDVSLNVNFSTLDQLNADHITYAYMLRHKGNPEGEWTILPKGHNTANFTALPKGEYELLVKATDRYGNWGEEVAQLSIVRLPAWWETWWSYTFYILMGIAIVTSIAYFHFRSRMQRMEIERLVALAQEMRKAPMAHETEKTSEDGRTNSSGAILTTEMDTENDTKTSSAPVLSKEDLKMLQRAKEKVEHHLDDPNYTTEQLASDMCMSRMSLYRKLQRTTGQTPTEFARMVRLHAAAEMLRTDGIPVSEVATRSGFSSPSYFTKCFKEAFGVLPGEYRQ